MKKRFFNHSITILSLICMFVALFVALPPSVLAQSNTVDCGDVDYTKGASKQNIDCLNPLKVGGSAQASQFSTPGGIVSFFLGRYAFPVAGMILFVMLIWGGFEMLTGAANKKNLDAGKQRVTAALIGFLMLFAAYWIAQILEVVFDIPILGL